MLSTTTYEGLVESLKIKDLTDFLKAQENVTLEGWSKMKAPEKKAEFLNALPQSEELRAAFVAFYNELMEADASFEVLEGTAEPAEPATVVEPEAEAPVPAVGPKATHATFVEGDFGQMVSDVAGLDAEQTTIALRAAEDDLELNHMRIGVLIMRVHDAQHYISAGYENIRGYIAGETGIDYRKAMQLARNARIVQEVGIPEAELKGVTWAALRHVLPVLTKENYKEWLEAARSLKHSSLIAKVGEEKAKQAGALPAPDGAPAKPEAIQKVFNVFPDQKATIDEAIKKAKVEANTDATGAALEAIAASYIGSPVSQSSMDAVMPDTTPDGLKKVFTKMVADTNAYEALMTVLGALEVVWPGAALEVELDDELLALAPQGEAAE